MLWVVVFIEYFICFLAGSRGLGVVFHFKEFFIVVGVEVIISFHLQLAPSRNLQRLNLIKPHYIVSQKTRTPSFQIINLGVDIDIALERLAELFLFKRRNVEVVIYFVCFHTEGGLKFLLIPYKIILFTYNRIQIVIARQQNPTQTFFPLLHPINRLSDIIIRMLPNPPYVKLIWPHPRNRKTKRKI